MEEFMKSFQNELEKISQRKIKRKSKVPLIIGAALGTVGVGLVGAAAIKHYQAMKVVKKLFERGLITTDKIQKIVAKPKPLTRFLLRRFIS